MKSKQIMFFALLVDFEPILKSIEEMFSIQYYETGLFDSKSTPGYKSIFEVPNLGYTKFGDWNRIDNYLIIPKNTHLKIEEIPQKKGGIKYAVDQGLNHVSITVKLGGIFLEKENIIIAGRVATISDYPFSNEIYKAFSRKIKKSFRYIGAFYVGKEAEKRLKEGWRLVQDEERSEEYDLSLNQS